MHLRRTYVIHLFNHVYETSFLLYFLFDNSFFFSLSLNDLLQVLWYKYKRISIVVFHISVCEEYI